MAGRFVQLPSQGEVLRCAEPFQMRFWNDRKLLLEELHHFRCRRMVKATGMSMPRARTLG